MLHRPHDHRMLGARDIVADEQFFIEFLAGPQASELDLEVAVGVRGVAHRAPGQADHAARQIDDAHRLTHIEHEHIATLPHGTRLDDQLRSLGDRHEVPDHIRVRHRHRAALADLLLEERHHRP